MVCISILFLQLGNKPLNISLPITSAITSTLAIIIANYIFAKILFAKI